MADFDISKAIEEAAQAKFEQSQTARDLMDNDMPANVSLSQLHAHLRGRTSERVSQALMRDLTVRRIYQKLVRSQAKIQMGEAIAASSEEFPERHQDGCRLRLQASNAESEQLYLIIELQDSRAKLPNKLSAFLGEEGFAELDLPNGRNGIIQALIEKQSGLAQLLGDPKTEVILT